MSWLTKRQHGASDKSNGNKEGNGKKINVLKAAFRVNTGSSSSATASFALSTPTSSSIAVPASSSATTRHASTVTKPRSQTLSAPAPLNLSASTSSAPTLHPVPPSPSTQDPFANLYGTLKNSKLQSSVPVPTEHRSPLNQGSSSYLNPHSVAEADDPHYQALQHHSYYEQQSTPRSAPIASAEAARRRALSNPSGPLHLSASTSSRSSPSTVSPNTSTGSQRRVQGSVVPGSAKFVSVNGNFVAPSQQQQQQLHQQQLGPSPSGWHRSSSAQEDNHENVIGEGQAGESMSMSQQASVRSVHLDPRMSWSH